MPFFFFLANCFIKKILPHLVLKALFQLEELLLQSDFFLVDLPFQSISARDTDRLSKAMVFIFYAHDKALELINHRISAEVLDAVLTETEGTLFRSNSSAPKLYSNFIRIVGLKYLWHTLVLAVH